MIEHLSIGTIVIFKPFEEWSKMPYVIQTHGEELSRIKKTLNNNEAWWYCLGKKGIITQFSERRNGLIYRKSEEAPYQISLLDNGKISSIVYYTQWWNRQEFYYLIEYMLLKI